MEPSYQFRPEAACKPLHTEANLWVLNCLPQHRIATSGKSLLNSIWARHKIIHSGACPAGVLYREGMSNHPWALVSIGWRKPRLICVHPLAKSEVVEDTKKILACGNTR